MVSIRVPLAVVAIGLAPLLAGSADRVWSAPADVAEPAWSAVYCLILAGLLLVVDLRALTRAQLTLLFTPVLLMLIWVLLLGTQVGSTWGPNHAIWSSASELLGVPLRATPSIAPHRLWFGVGIQLSFFLAFLIGFLVSVERQGAKLLMEGLAISGVVYATIALGLISYDFSGVLWGDRPGTLDSLAFPFPNRNHAATFYGSCSLLCLSQLMGVLLPLRGRTMRLSDLYWETLSSNPWQAALWAVGLLICLTATFLTKSRAGTLLSLLMLISCAGFYAFRFAGRQPLRLMFTGAAAFLGVVFVELWGSGGLASRIAALGLWDAERLAVYRSTINMILDHPWIGTGLGTFVLAFPAYRSPDIGSTLVWDKAHNTLLEIAAEQGLPFSICLIVVSSYVALRLIRCVVRGQSLKYVTPAFFVGSLGVLHSLVDFPLQNVGFSTFFAAIIGCGYSRCAQRRESFSSSVAMATSQAVNGS